MQNMDITNERYGDLIQIECQTEVKNKLSNNKIIQGIFSSQGSNTMWFENLKLLRLFFLMKTSDKLEFNIGMVSMPASFFIWNGFVAVMLVSLKIEIHALQPFSCSTLLEYYVIFGTSGSRKNVRGELHRDIPRVILYMV